MRARRSMVLLFVLTAVACGGEPNGSGATGRPRPTGSALNATTAPSLPTDRFALPAVDPRSFAELLAELRGTPVLVNVWGSWCGPCVEEAPHLASASATYGRRVQFLGLDILDDRPGARAFMERFGWRYPSVFDAPGAVRDDLGFVGQPVTVIYDAEGRRTFQWQGPVSAEMLDRELAAVA